MENTFKLSSKNTDSLPKFNWTPDRWAVARTKNVEKLHKHWLEDPSRVAVLEDPKFNNDNLVILKKEYLDELLNRCEKISRSYSENMSSTKVLLQTIDLVSELASTKSCDDTMKKAFSILSELRNRFSHELVETH